MGLRRKAGQQGQPESMETGPACPEEPGSQTRLPAGVGLAAVVLASQVFCGAGWLAAGTPRSDLILTVLTLGWLCSSVLGLVLACGVVLRAGWSWPPAAGLLLVRACACWAPFLGTAVPADGDSPALPGLALYAFTLSLAAVSLLEHAGWLGVPRRGRWRLMLHRGGWLVLPAFLLEVVGLAAVHFPAP